MGANILIVGGERKFIDHLKVLLEEQGHLTSDAIDESGALSFLSKEKYDLILFDPAHLEQGMDLLDVIGPDKHPSLIQHQVNNPRAHSTFPGYA